MLSFFNRLKNQDTSWHVITTTNIDFLITNNKTKYI